MEYDVFLSSCKDGHFLCTEFLRQYLESNGISTFLDYRRGDEISGSVLEVIEASKLSFVVFSARYAKSRQCLDELVKIIECRKKTGLTVIPVYFETKPTDVKHQTGYFGVAFRTIEERFPEYSEKWKAAMREAAILPGFFGNQFRNEREFFREITTEAFRRLQRKAVKIADKPQGGSLESRIWEVSSVLDISSEDEVIMVGIYGYGGMGKTTIARGVYNSLGHRFEAKCFLSDVRENSSRGLMHLQKVLLTQMLGDIEFNIRTTNHGMSLIRQGLCTKKILLVLDDVDELEQLEALAGGNNWFGNGSRIIITTMSKQLLAYHGISSDKICEARGLNDQEAHELFRWAASQRSELPRTLPTKIAMEKKVPTANLLQRNRKEPATDLWRRKGKEVRVIPGDISNRVVQNSNGNPLILKILGSSFSETRINEWESILDEYEALPKKRVHDMLKIGYDSLEDSEREVFLDIAFFFKGEDEGYIKQVVDACGFSSERVIAKLIDKSLISIEENKICMHDLIQEMGRKIVREESPLEPSKRSRLCDPKDVLYVLSRDLGTEKIQGMLFDGDQEVKWSGETFKKINNLRILIIRGSGIHVEPTYLPSSLRLLDWKDYPSASLPQDFHGRQLVVLKLVGSAIAKSVPLKIHRDLTFINFSDCDFLKEIPDVSGIPNLSKLHACYCQNLKKVHDSVGSLKLLSELRLLGSSISDFPARLTSKFLEVLDISLNYEIDLFPYIMRKMLRLKLVDVGHTSIRELPPSIAFLRGLEVLVLRSCESLCCIPSELSRLQNLKELDMENCTQAPNALRAQEIESPFRLSYLIKLNLSECNLTEEDIPVILRHFPELKSLFIARNNLLFCLPNCFQEFRSLEILDIASCTRLTEIDAVPHQLRTVVASECISLSEKSSNSLLLQGLYTIPNSKVIVPGEKIPESFQRYEKGGTISFWSRQSQYIDTCAMCFVIESARHDFELQFTLSINGSRVLQSCSPFRNVEPMSHVFMYDLHEAFKFFPGELYEIMQQHEQNHVEISCTLRYNFCKEVSRPKKCAVNVYDWQKELIDVEFVHQRDRH